MKTLFSMSVAAFFAAAPAHATLIDRGQGLIYDSAQNLTWLQDSNLAKTQGFSVDGLMSWDAARIWVDHLVFSGYDDWRLPSLSVQSLAVGLTFVSHSEIDTALQDSRPDCGPLIVNPLTTVTCTPGLPSPFLNVESTPFWYGLEDGDAAWAGAQFLSHVPTMRYPKSERLQVWAVRNGDVSSVPEPDVLALLSLGMVCMGLASRSRT